jgi:O-6-methylguanine DNA methyltransferase
MMDLKALRTPAPPGFSAAVQLATGLAYGYHRFGSPLGEVGVAFSVAGVVGVELAEGLEATFATRYRIPVVPATPPLRWITLIERALDRGRPGALPLDLGSVSDFRRRALIAAATIPYGEVRPYAWVARETGNPEAVRAVGSAMAANPVPLIVPCHRVVRSDGRLGEYSMGGPDSKRRVLTSEGVDLAELEALAAGGTRLTGSTTTKIFCHPSCHAARRSKSIYRVDFSDRNEAEAAGYRACRLCRP